MTNILEYWMYEVIISELQKKYDNKVYTLFTKKDKDVSVEKFNQVIGEMKNNKFDSLGKLYLTLEKTIAQRDEVSELIKQG